MTKTAERVNLLIVDDSPDKVMALTAVLEDLGQNIIKAYSGREALRCLLKDDFAVILLDVNMPDLDGFEAAALIRQRKRSEHTPIIFVTAYNDDTHVAKGYSLGAVDYITTPIVPEVLRTKVGVFVDLYQKSDMVRRQADHRVQLAREQAARHVAEESLRRSSLLAEASKLLARSLDYDTTLSNISRAVVPALADACDIVVRDGQGRLQLASPGASGSGGRGPGIQGLAIRGPGIQGAAIQGAAERGASRLGPPNLERDSPLALAISEAIGTGHARLIRDDVVEEVSAARSLEKEKPPSAIAFPLLARNVSHGAMVLRFNNVRRRLSIADVALAQDLAARAATALDNARLYQTICEGERRKDEFLAMLGHELRNPLAAITNASELMNLLEPRDSAFGEAQEIVRKQASLMKRLVDDLLDVSRIASGRIQLQKTTVEARELVDRVVEAMAPLFSARQHALHVALPPTPTYLSADPFRLEQILSNLLVNAAKYTDPGGKVWLTVGLEDQTVFFRVKDTGIGISADVVPRVFELFAQADQSLHRSQGGLGIGLTIVHGLVTLHGGQVLVHSEGLGRGAEFVVQLPALSERRRMETEPIVKPRQVVDGSPRRILVVEDQFAVSKVTVALLKKLGHQVWAAADGPTAISAALQHRPEVVFMDIGLPGMDGYEVARRLRGEMGREAPLLIALTGYGQQDDRRRAAEAGFDRHLVKPVGLDALQDVLIEAGSARPEASAETIGCSKTFSNC